MGRQAIVGDLPGMHNRLTLQGDRIVVIKEAVRGSEGRTQEETRRLLLKGGVREGRVEINGMDVFYLEAGMNEKPKLLLIHGGGTSSSYKAWGGNILQLAEHYYVIAPDLPGYGNTKKPKRRCSLNYYVKDFVGPFMDSVGMRTAQVIGSSLGGGIALGFALDNSQRVEKLVLIDSYGLYNMVFTIPARSLLMLPHMSRVAAEHIRSRKIVGALLRSASGHMEIPNEAVDEACRYLSGTDTPLSDAFLEFLNDQMACSPKDIAKDLANKVRNRSITMGFRTNYMSRLSELESLGMKVLLVHGEHDILFPLSSAREAASRIASCTLIEIKDAGHWPHSDRPEEFNSAALGFLAGSSDVAVRGSKGIHGLLRGISVRFGS